ncbi:MAG: GIY-YIG nuclease family protein [Candidatus Methanofastidiosa archaeon]|nr:GIY-YIG nuclease family protein [Candidatus Methanofastidiosa archaeon]
MEDDSLLNVGSLGALKFDKGLYAYVGSAMNGLDARIGRHLRGEKRLRWHIDHLLKEAIVTEVYFKESDVKEECMFAQRLNGLFPVIRRFGSSDCQCAGHLFSIGRDQKLGPLLGSWGFEKYVQVR